MPALWIKTAVLMTWIKSSQRLVVSYRFTVPRKLLVKTSSDLTAPFYKVRTMTTPLEPVADTVAVSWTFADNELTSQTPIIDTLPASPGSREESPGQLEEEQADAEPTAEPFDTETEIQPKVDSSQALGDHSYSMPPQETNYSYEENCINRLEHGAENDLEMKDSAYDVQGEPVCPSEREIIMSKPTSSRIPVIKPSSASSVSGVRNSKSHENYLESSNVDPSMQCVDIDFEDDIATSVDVLHYQEQSAALCAERQSKSLDNSPERGSDKHSEKNTHADLY